jgi:hypothetical protein
MISHQFNGGGPTIYIMDFRAWRDLFKSNGEGDAVYDLLLGMRAKEGAVLVGMEIHNGNTNEELNMNSVGRGAEPSFDRKRKRERAERKKNRKLLELGGDLMVH